MSLSDAASASSDAPPRSGQFLIAHSKIDSKAASLCLFCGTMKVIRVLATLLLLLFISPSSAEPAPILVTGASGFLGGHVIHQLLSAGHHVQGTVRGTIDSSKYDFLRSLAADASASAPGAKLTLVQADLVGSTQAMWNAVAAGCAACVHVASPFPSSAPVNGTEEIIRPALEGTQHVVGACLRARTVKRIVLTSSVSAVEGKQTKPSCDEADWTDPTEVGYYEQSKTLAEREAWRLVAEWNKAANEEKEVDLVVINPTMIMGPLLPGQTAGASLEVVGAAMNIFRLPAVRGTVVHVEPY